MLRAVARLLPAPPHAWRSVAGMTGSRPVVRGVVFGAHGGTTGSAVGRGRRRRRQSPCRPAAHSDHSTPTPLPSIRHGRHADSALHRLCCDEVGVPCGDAWLGRRVARSRRPWTRATCQHAFITPFPRLRTTHPPPPPPPPSRFPLPRRRVGVLEGDILEVVDSWPTEKRQWAHGVIEEVEVEAGPGRGQLVIGWG